MQFDVLMPDPFLGGKQYQITDCYSAYESSFNNRLHFHNFYEMSVIYEGCSDFLINGGVYPLRDRSIQLIRPSDYHRQQTREGQHIRYYNIIFSPEFLTRQMQNALSRTGGALCANLDGESWRSCLLLAQAVYRAAAQQDADDLTDLFVRCNVENLCILLLRRSGGEALPCSDLPYEGIRRAVLYIHSHYREPVTLAQAAAEAGLSPSHFSAVFHKALGCTFSGYLLEYRLMSAERYLRQQDLSVKQIAFACGFRSYPHFITAFAKRFGCAPGAWRGRQKPAGGR